MHFYFLNFIIYIDSDFFEQFHDFFFTLKP